MKYFEKYTSNCIGGSGNQFFFRMKKGEVRTGRIFYKISVGGEYEYSLLFSNIIDSTYADGSESHINLICPEWTIHKASVARVGGHPNEEGCKLWADRLFEAVKGII